MSYPNYGSAYPPVESGLLSDSFNSFSEKSIRSAFIRKVFGIVVVQLLITVAICAVFNQIASVQTFAAQNPWMLYVAIGVSLISLILLTCCNIARSFPANLICLTFYTLAQALTIGFTAAFIRGDTVLYAVGITTILVFGLILFAYQTKIDFTVISGILFVFTFCLLIFGIFCAIWPGRVMILIYSSLGAIIFSLWLVVDIQMLVGGNRAVQISPEDYIMAALLIYQDIINIFLFILSIFSGR